MDDDVAARLREAIAGCPDVVFWRPAGSPAAALAALADAAREVGAEWDTYGDGGIVEVLEAEVAGLLGHEAAVLFPTGVMAQQAALRSWCDRAGCHRVAVPDLAHPLHHEEDGPRVLHGFEFPALTRGPQAPTAAHLDAVPGRLGAVMVELPLRDAGCVLPTWDELAQLSERCRARPAAFHADGARIWECQPHFARDAAAIGALFDSVYVSFYKGLGQMHGAAVAGPGDLAAELRLWRRRMGGAIYRMAPLAVGALHGLRTHVPRMGDYVAWAREFAAALAGHGARIDPPATQTFVAHVDGDADAINARVLDHIAREGLVPCGVWTPGAVPGTARTEFIAYADALRHDPRRAADRVAGLAGPGTPPPNARGRAGSAP